MPIKDVLSIANAVGSDIIAAGSGEAFILNPIGRAIKSAGMAVYNKVRTHDLHSQHSPEELSQLKEQYMTQIGLKDATYSADAFDKFVGSRPTDFNVFKDTKGLKDLSVYDKLSIDSDTTKAVNAAINDILKPSAKLAEAQKDYKHSIDAIKIMAAEIPQKRSPGQLIGLMMEVRNESVEKIKAQHALEIQKFEACFPKMDAPVDDPLVDAAKMFEEEEAIALGTPTVTKQLATSLGLSDATAVNAVKDNMLKDLKANQEKQLKEFETAANDSVKKLQDAASVQMKTFHFLANLYKNHTDMQKVINAYRNKHPEPLSQDAASITVNGAKQKVNFVGMGLNDLNVIKTVTGKEITNNKDGSFSMEFTGLTDARYRWSSERKALADFMVMAQAVRATGKPVCRFDLTDFRDKEIGKLRAREAYEAAIKSGFPPDMIEIKIDGVVQKPEELFAEHRNTFARLNNLSPKIKERFEKLEKIEPHEGDSLKKAKEHMETLRNDGKNKEAKAVAAKAAEARDGPERVSIIANN